MSIKYIIDTNVLIQQPQVLSRDSKRNLVIPEAVLDELLQGRGRSQWHDITTLVLLSADRGRLVIEGSSSGSQVKINLSDRNAQRLSGTDFDIINLAHDYVSEGNTVSACVVTNDKVLALFLSGLKINVLSGNDFLEQSKDEQLNEDIYRKAEEVISSQKRYLIISFALGILASLLGSLVYSNINAIVGTISVWGTMIGLPVLGVGLFWYRERFRLSYGTFELCAGILMAWYVFFPRFDYATLGVTEGIQVLGGLYVMVRGLDNISKAIVGTRLESFWKKVF